MSMERDELHDLWETVLLDQLTLSLANVNFSSAEDIWVWGLEENGLFSVKSTYVSLSAEINIALPLGDFQEEVFEQIWKSPAPSKSIAFAWQLLHDRIPTRFNLERRGVLQPVEFSDCVLCVGGLVRLLIIIPPNLFHMFACLSDAAIGKDHRKGVRLIWNATVWLIWKARNDTLFGNGFKEAEQVVEDIKRLSWRWSLARLKMSPLFTVRMVC
ncbi:unnamed protein product [Trifolium pratense]|uniref:Uncharacterized protein n=1 Tax=Trifolium pratense TaxID=57577 RepID=A0ACB0LZ28_TRIPR|nr:unnamed protein product [Trifolium pratense]